MKDELLMQLKMRIDELSSKDASYVAGFLVVHKIMAQLFKESGTPLQNAFIEYLTDDLEEVYKVKSEHGKFKHIVK
jgi:hypothetical protein